MSLLCRCSALMAVTGLALGHLAWSGLPTAEERSNPTAKKAVRTDLYGDPLPPGAIARLGTVRLRHPGGVETIAFAPGGQLLASAGRDSIRLWEVATGKQVVSIPLQQPVFSIAFSPDGKTLASGHWRGWVYLWDTATGRVLRKFGREHLDTINSVVFSPDGKTLAGGGSDGIVRLWEVSTGFEIRQIKDESRQIGLPVHTVAFLPDGEVIAATAGQKGQIAYSPDGELVAWATEKFTIRKRRSGEEILRTDLHARHVTFAPASTTVACWGVSLLGQIRLWDTARKQEIQVFEDEQNVTTVAFSPDGKIVGSAGNGGMIRLWEVSTGRELPQSHGQHAGGKAVFSPDGQSIAIPGYRKIGLWDMASQRQRRALDYDFSGNGFVAFSLDGKAVISMMRQKSASRSDAQSLCWWDLATDCEAARLPATDIPLALSPDGRVLAARQAESIRLWDMTSRKLVKTLQPPAGFRSRHGPVAFSHDGTILAQGGEDYTICFWDVTTGNARAPLNLALPLRPPGLDFTPRDGRMIKTLTIAPDGRTLVVSGEDLAISLWDRQTGNRVLPPIREHGWANVAALSPDSKLLATPRRGSDPRDGTLILNESVLLWETATGTLIREFAGHKGTVRSLTFSWDGRMLASSNSDTTTLVWHLLEPIKRDGEHQHIQLGKAWDALAAKDAATAYPAILALVAAGDRGVTYLRKRLQPSEAVPPEQMRRLIADLDSGQFEVREAATGELRRRHTQVEPALREALGGQPSPEVRRRIQELLETLYQRPFPADCLRRLRAIQVLELIGSPAARQFLRDLASGDPLAYATGDAKTALERLDRRIHR